MSNSVLCNVSKKKNKICYLQKHESRFIAVSRTSEKMVTYYAAKSRLLNDFILPLNFEFKAVIVKLYLIGTGKNEVIKLIKQLNMENPSELRSYMSTH